MSTDATDHIRPMSFQTARKASAPLPTHDEAELIDECLRIVGGSEIAPTPQHIEGLLLVIATRDDTIVDRDSEIRRLTYPTRSSE